MFLIGKSKNTFVLINFKLEIIFERSKETAEEFEKIETLFKQAKIVLLSFYYPINVLFNIQ